MGKPNHQADIKNPNKGVAGNNIAYDKNQGNRGKQLQPPPNSNSATPPREKK